MQQEHISSNKPFIFYHDDTQGTYKSSPAHFRGGQSRLRQTHFLHTIPVVRE